MSLLISSVQDLSIEVTGGGTKEVSISSVDTSKTFLVVSGMFTSTPNTTHSNWGYRVDLKDSTTVRVVAGSQTITIRVFVMEFSEGLSVQRYTTTLSNGQGNTSQSITSADITKTFVNKLGPGSSSSVNSNPSNHSVSIRLNSSTNAIILRDGSSQAITVSWEVVTFD